MALEQLSTRALLRLYADILTELIDRGVVRSRNAPAGDLAGTSLRMRSAASWRRRRRRAGTLRVGDRRLQVKVRLIAAGDWRSHSYSPFRSWDFDACVFVLLDAHTYDVARAIEVPAEGVQELAREVKWVRLSYRYACRPSTCHWSRRPDGGASAGARGPWVTEARAWASLSPAWMSTRPG
jgi:hypothetical protein